MRRTDAALTARPAAEHGTGLIAEVEVRGFRSIDRVVLRPPAVCALVGEAMSGKSALLEAMRAALDPDASVAATDLGDDADALHIRVRLASGTASEVKGLPPGTVRTPAPDAPPVLFLPAAARSSNAIATTAATSGADHARHGAALFQDAYVRARGGLRSESPSASAAGIVDAFLECCASGISGLVVLIEEPELFLRPQAQRYLYRLIRRFARQGNQVVYSTHSPAFLNVARLDELVFVERRSGESTMALQPELLTPDDDFRVLSEFDAERAELFLARAVLLVEGQTEKLAFPFVFQALGHDPDLAGISIVECGGKANIVLFARVCRAAGVPFVAVYDRDAPAGRRPSPGDRALASEISALAGPGRVVELAPDFEGIAGMERHRHGKPERAWRRFAELAVDAMPPQLAEAVKLVVDLADGAAR